MHWDGPEFVIENYVSGLQVSVQPALCQLLHGLDGFQESKELSTRIDAQGKKGREVLAALTEANVLLTEGSELDERDRQINANWIWGHNARYFHFSTQLVAYTFDHDLTRSYFENKAVLDPPPSPFMDVPGDRVALSGSFESMRGEMWETLKARRTVRRFRRKAISLDELSTILRWTWGKTRYFNESRLDRRVVKTSPSGGARHPIEVYPIVQRVDGVPAGIYHYAVEHDALVCLKTGQFEDELLQLFSGQVWVRDAAAVFLLTAVLPRSMWKYDHSRAYRVVLLDAGHLGQTFHLVVTALGLGSFTTAALQDREIERFLGIDGIKEVAIYAGAAGKRFKD